VKIKHGKLPLHFLNCRWDMKHRKWQVNVVSSWCIC
jgi:hypothetical protein